MGSSLLLLRAMSGPGVGIGHASRSLALAEAWASRGQRAVLLTEALPDWLAAEAAASGVEVRDPEDVPHETAAWIVLDGYNLGGSALLPILETGSHLVGIDDHGRSRFTRDPRVHLDVVVDMHLGAHADPYLRDRPRVLLGPRYALLRRPYWSLRAAHPNEPPRRVGVILGGQPPEDLLRNVSARLTEAGYEVVTFDGRSDAAPGLATLDACVSAAGVTSLELAALGRPMVLVAVSENQVPVREAMSSAGAALAAEPDPDEIVRAVARLRDPELSRRLVDSARRLVDDAGAQRVTAVLADEEVLVRRARPDDARLLWNWANDPTTRAASFSTAPIPWSDHVEWFERQLADPHALVLVGEEPNGIPVGTARFNAEGTEGEIAISLDPGSRGHGLSTPLIKAALLRARIVMGLETVHAWIRPDNIPSRRAFERAGFRPAPGPEVVQHRSGNDAVHLVWKAER